MEMWIVAIAAAKMNHLWKVIPYLRRFCGKEEKRDCLSPHKDHDI